MTNKIEMDTNEQRSEPDEMVVDWERFGKRMIAASHLGIRIEQNSGHRWIHIDGNADNSPIAKDRPDLVAHVPGLTEGTFLMKEYGSFEEALNRIDSVLVSQHSPTLLQYFDSHVNVYGDLGVVFGHGTQ